MKALLAGWFSFSNGHATAGDLLVRDTVSSWLNTAGVPYDMALAPPFEGGVDLLSVDATRYTHVVFVCGPFERGELEARMLNRFSHCRLIGINLSMQVPLEEWNPFDFLIERDSSADSNPDVVFISRTPRVPVVGICRVEAYPEALVARANAAIERLVCLREMSVVEIDTRLDANASGLRSPAEIESLFARMDVIVTTRLHGMVLALKNGIPVIAIDPMAGGAKIRRQARTINWPAAFSVDEMQDEDLTQAFDYCLTDAARDEAAQCGTASRRMVQELRDRFVGALTDPALIERNYALRSSATPDVTWMAPFLERASEDTPETPPRRRRMTPGRRIARWLRMI